MSRISSSACAILFAGIFAQPVLAADIIEETPYDWTGFYIGGHAGYGWSKKEWESSTFPGGSIDVDQNLDGILGGFQGGFDYQIDNFVLGVGGDFSWTDIDDHDTGPLGFRHEVSLDWLGTLTARIGFAVDRALFYVKGGAAWVEEDFSLKGPNFSGSTDNNENGWVIGAGAEWAFADNWSVFGEYNYLDFGESHNIDLDLLGSIPAPPPDEWDIKQKVQTVKIGVNFRF